MTEFGPALSRRALVVGAAMASTAAVAYAAVPRRSGNRLVKHRLEDLIAPQIADWRWVSNKGVVTTTETSDNDGYDQQLMRVYAAPDLPRIMLLIAYGSTQGGSLQLHRPETCYPGQGFRLADFRDLDLALGVPAVPVQARAFTARRDDRIERLLYWTRVAAAFPRNTAEEYRAILASVVTGTVPDGILVRVSTLGDTDATADQALARFAGAMVTAAPPLARALLVGGAPTGQRG
ncbi:exosortase C-terminal domain/associated protein EpsI [Polymorphobacter fuscus]|uniref:EpsI family protein n=1 Tax=Sandarakinorhabdus fusca TaxID=1439888 RepID=A0A7C9KX69_9SPHN|nr:exosortase C-terminal domain/associated protein EpsI [Polymorphobacter fuscus]KAB7647922.1 EpsI family protein [Polymorphobacter fuscus]MQT17242.1 EpsI family protein [Polymorphobacter fuscus]NJC08764.1 EpsI family protein [Polymorphobacter fuscus]